MGLNITGFGFLDIFVLVVVFGKNLLPDNLSRSVSCKGGASEKGE